LRVRCRPDDEPFREAQAEFAEFLLRLQEHLSARQRQVLELALAQQAQGDIARLLQVSLTIIGHDMKQIQAKLEAELIRLD
jgi:DNA-binding CsgD family transcriptional regulator